MASDYLFEAEKKLRETKEQVADLQSRLAAILALLGADTQFEAEMNLRKLKEEREMLIEALRTLVFACTDYGNEQFPGHYEAYLRAVALPRAKEALDKVKV